MKGGGIKMLSEKNKNVRIKLDKYIRKFGVKKVHIAREIGMTGTTVGLFLKGQRELTLATLEEIEKIIEEKM